jgi:hypothetical protein
LIWRIEENLPLIKVVYAKKKIKKKKNKKIKKFTLRYLYIPQKFRFQVGLRLLSFLIKSVSSKLLTGLLKHFIIFLIDPSISQFNALKKKIYTQLLISL